MLTGLFESTEIYHAGLTEKKRRDAEARASGGGSAKDGPSGSTILGPSMGGRNICPVKFGMCTRVAVRIPRMAPSGCAILGTSAVGHNVCPVRLGCAQSGSADPSSYYALILRDGEFNRAFPIVDLRCMMFPLKTTI